jgi:hypothetical protein
MNGRISWLGVFMRLVGAVAVVLLTYNPTGYSFYHWAMRDFASITAVKAFARGTVVGRMGHLHPNGICLLGCSRTFVKRARTQHSGLDAQGLRDTQPG